MDNKTINEEVVEKVNKSLIKIEEIFREIDLKKYGIKAGHTFLDTLATRLAGIVFANGIANGILESLIPHFIEESFREAKRIVNDPDSTKITEGKIN